jgi:hypothetical protein
LGNEKIIHRAAIAVHAKRTNRRLERYELFSATRAIALDTKRIEATRERTSAMHPASHAVERDARSVVAKFQYRAAPNRESRNRFTRRNARLAREP